MHWIKRILLAITLLVVACGAGIWYYETYVNDFSTLSHYETLGITSDAPISEIKRAFRELSLRYHPDKSTSAPAVQTKRFHRISDAYHVLSNAESRSQYDQTLVEEARIRQAMRLRDPLRFMPPTWSDPTEILIFYGKQLPQAVIALVLELVDFRLACMALVALGSLVFLLDLMQRFGHRVVDWWIFRSAARQSPEDRQAAIQAARERQQQALAQATASAKLRHRRR